MPAQIGIFREPIIGIRRRTNIHGDGLRRAAQIGVIIIGAHLIAHGNGIAVAAHHGWNAKARDAIFHRIAKAIPIRHHHGQAGCHGLHRGQAEGFLDIIHGQGEDIRRRPGFCADFGILAIQQMHLHIRAGLRRGISKGGA